MKILKVYGDDDYAALTFEQGNYDLLETYNNAKLAGGFFEFEDSCYAEAYEFDVELNDETKELFNFILNEIGDYDYQKHTNLYLVEE